jgi:uncharacterized RDD family membrane protein YckC
MGEHRRHEPSFKLKLLCFSGGALAMAVAVLEFMYRSSMGLLGNRVTARLLALGLILVVAPFWSFFRKKKSATPNQ